MKTKLKEMLVEILSEKLSMWPDGTYQAICVCIPGGTWTGAIGLPNAHLYNITVNSFTVGGVSYGASVVNTGRWGFNVNLSRIPPNDIGIINFTIQRI